MDVEFRTGRLWLRRLRHEDAGWLAALDADPRVMRYIRAPSTPEQAAADAIARIEWDLRHPHFGLWAAVDLESREIHGWVGLKPMTLEEKFDGRGIELGFRLRPESWGVGFAREGGARLLQYGFENLELPHVVGVAMAGNIGSKRVLESLGFRYLERVNLGEDWDQYRIERP